LLLSLFEYLFERERDSPFFVLLARSIFHALPCLFAIFTPVSIECIRSF
jgi:hypothetical protein